MIKPLIMTLKSLIKPVELAINFISSIVTASFGFWAVYLLQGLIILYFSYDFDIIARFSLPGIHFITPYNDLLWSKDAVVTIFLAPPIFFFFGGLSFLFLLGLLKSKSTSLLFFILWISVLFNGSAFGTIIEEGVAHSGLYRITEALNIGMIPLIISVSVSIYFLYLTGVILAKLILLNSEESWKRKGRLKPTVFLFFFLFPFLINLLIFLLYVKINTGQIIIFALSFTILLPSLWVSAPKSNNFNLKPPSPFNLLDAITLLLLLLFTFFIYTSIKHGIELPLHITMERSDAQWSLSFL